MFQMRYQNVQEGSGFTAGRENCKTLKIVIFSIFNAKIEFTILHIKSLKI